MYAINGWRPDPAKCWECYQPPIYYLISAYVLKGTNFLLGSSLAGWKAVQTVGLFASIGTLLLTWQILRLWIPDTRWVRNIALLTLAMLPQDLYASAFVGNDSLLVFCTTLAITGYSIFVHTDHPWRGICLIAAGVVGAVWTKQSGAVSLLLPGMVLVGGVLRRFKVDTLKLLRPITPAMALVMILSMPVAMADEIWRTSVTGKFLFSNQHVYDYTKNQPPGSVDLVSFSSFRLIELWKDPVMAPATLPSFWTELFARVWYDYEPRYLPKTTGTLWLARGLYALGLGITAIAVVGVFVFLFRGRQRLDALAPLLLFLAYLAVPVLQTSRFPYFSSMKAIFVLPAVSIAVLFVAFGLLLIPGKLRTVACITLGSALTLLGGAHVYAIVTLADHNIATSTLPLWPIPILH